MKLTIAKLYTNKRNTQYGEKDQYSVEFQEKPGIKLNAWAGNWNKNWKIGEVIEINKEQIKKNEYAGKTYLNIQAPPEAKFQGVGRQEFMELEARVADLEAKMDSEEIPVVEGQIDFGEEDVEQPNDEPF